MQKPIITIHTQGISFNLKNKTKIRKWIITVILKEKKTPGEINYIFCSDDFLLELNKKHLNHSTLTDIITFDYSKDTGNISGDIFISIDRIKENFVLYKTSFENELLRVMIHGVLHLCGYKDKTPATLKIMRAKENASLALYERSFSTV